MNTRNVKLSVRLYGFYDFSFVLEVRDLIL